MDEQNSKDFTATNPVDFTDALKWYAIAKEKQNDYDNAIAKLKESMENNMRLNQELNKLKAEIDNIRTHQDQKQNGDTYLVHLLRDAGRNVRELRVVFREPDPWEEDEEGVF